MSKKQLQVDRRLTLGKLALWLDDTGLPGTTEIMQSSDAEGNAISPTRTLTVEDRRDVDGGSGTVIVMWPRD